MAATGSGNMPIVISCVVGWYLTSFSTLLLNKYLLSELGVRPNTLAVVQMISTAIYGALKEIVLKPFTRSRGGQKVNKVSDQLRNMESGGVLSNGDKEKGPKSSFRQKFFQMSIVGVMRFATVVLGLVSLKHVAASFTETIKSSAPFFTVFFAWIMLGETTPVPIMCSLVPVAGGLLVASVSELSFNMIGFFAAVATNSVECVQNVFSKRLLSKDYTPSQLQFYTSVTALILQVPLWLVLPEESSTTTPSLTTLAPDEEALEAAYKVAELNATGLAEDPPLASLEARYIWMLLWVDGLLYHLQSVVAYMVMSHLSPVTVSVLNTAKRVLVILLSVLVFKNTVTAWTWAGTAICISGVMLYNYFKQNPNKGVSSLMKLPWVGSSKADQ